MLTEKDKYDLICVYEAITKIRTGLCYFMCPDGKDCDFGNDSPIDKTDLVLDIIFRHSLFYRKDVYESLDSAHVDKEYFADYDLLYNVLHDNEIDIPQKVELVFGSKIGKC